MIQEIISRLERIESLSTLAAKNVLNIDDVAILTGMSKGYVYQLTHDKKIPFYKPTGKQIYFDRSEVEAWMKRNRVNSVDEAQSKAVSYVVRKGGRYESGRWHICRIGGGSAKATEKIDECPAKGRSL